MYNLRKNIAQRFFCKTPVRRAEPLDPVQELFVKYLREYYKKLKENNGVLFEVSPELLKDREEKYNALSKHYFGDLEPTLYDKFPEMKFDEPEVGGIDTPDVHPFLKKLDG